LEHLWKWAVSFKPRPLYPRYPLNGGLGGQHSQSGCKKDAQSAYVIFSFTYINYYKVSPLWRSV
jgi:hypothetical protein